MGHPRELGLGNGSRANPALRTSRENVDSLSLLAPELPEECETPRITLAPPCPAPPAQPTRFARLPSKVVYDCEDRFPARRLPSARFPPGVRMTRLPPIAAAILLASLTILGSPVSVAHAQPAGQPSNGAPTGPLDPAAALARFRLLDPHLTIELVAAEPEVIDPVSIAFDESGGLWVVEMRDYPWGPRRPGETADSGNLVP